MRYTHEEWLAELKRRFGDNNLDWAFKCPACGKVSTLREFKEAGASPNDSYQNCIGRFNGNMHPATNISNNGCDWAAYGLLGNLSKGDTVVTSEGKEIEVFSMADVPIQKEQLSA